MEKLEKQPCVFCHKKELTLIQDSVDIPFFGKTYVFSMKCNNCGFSKSDVEAEERKEPCKITFHVSNKKDLNTRVVKSSEASITIKELKMNSRPGPASDGYVSNIEGVLQRFKDIVESQRDTAEDEEDKKKAKNLLKKMWKVECGDIPITIIIEDPSGNSAIISEKAQREKLKTTPPKE